MQFLRPNAIAQVELAYLRNRAQEASRSVWVVRGMVLLLLYISAIIPIWIYMDDTQGAVLLVMAAFFYIVHLLICIRTLLIAIDSIAREQRANSWEILVVTGVDAHSLVWGKWRAVVRHVWQYHLFTALPRVGLAYGIAQYLHVIPLNWSVSWSNLSNCPYGLPLCYISHGGDPTHLNPQLVTALLGVVVIVLYSLIEAGLVSALGLLVALRITRFSVFRVILGLMIRAILVLLPVLLMIRFDLIWRLEHPILETYCRLREGCGRYERWFNADDVIARELATVRRIWRWVEDSSLLVASTFTDGGTLLSANLMRPFDERSQFAKQGRFTNGARNYLRNSNLPFVIRNIVIALAGMGLQSLFIVLLLRLAQFSAVRRQNVSPVVKSLA
jgi:hypothetical protein